MLKPKGNVIIQTPPTLSRHSGRDCRNPEHREVFVACHPWLLDLGNPCRDDAISLT